MPALHRCGTVMAARDATRVEHEELVTFLADCHLIDPTVSVSAERLSGGVSSHVWLVRQGPAAIVVKRALERLLVDDEWHVPVERGRYEAEWLSAVSEAFPGYCPDVLGYDATSGYLAMSFLDPSRYRVWKRMLMDGVVSRQTAAAVGVRLVDIHNKAAGSPSLGARFPTDALFASLRIEPYLSTTARRHPTLASAIQQIADETLRTKLTLVHGDVSPKNILIGDDGPVFLDAECAWWGDPAFDLAFCLNHLLLKCVVHPEKADALVASFDALADAYLSRVRWEPAATLEARAARLLPALFLARADGKSPVEYATEADRRRIRAHAIPNILQPAAALSAFAASWKAQLP